MVDLVGRIFCVMIPRHPRFTLFPYTTLFRSVRELKERGLVDRIAGSGTYVRERTIGEGGALFGLLIDRKSTRLNSSHANTSYAVFCLKKKTNNLYAVVSGQASFSSGGLTRTL